VKPFRFILIGGVLLCGALGAFAQSGETPAESPPAGLAAAFEAAWQRAVTAREAEGQFNVATAGVKAAGRYWAAPPALELSYRDDRFDDDRGQRESEVALAWPLWLPGQRSAHLASSGADVQLASAAKAVARLRVAGEVREAAWELAARKAEAELAEAHARDLQLLRHDVVRRVAAGDLAQVDALAAQAEALEAQSTAEDARQRLDAAGARWTTLTGLAPTVPVDEAPAEADLAQHPERLWTSASIERARKTLDEARLTRRDPPELKLGLKEERDGNGAGVDRSVGVTLRVPFGTDDRNLVRDAKVLSELEVAELAAQRTDERLTSELAVARRALASTAARLDAALARAAAARERRMLLERSFQAGELALAELLRARVASSQAEIGLHRLQAEHGLARARLLQSSGILP